MAFTAPQIHCMATFPVSSSRGGQAYAPINAAMGPRYCSAPQTDTKAGLITFSPSFSPGQLHPTFDGDSNFPVDGELTYTPDGVAYWIDRSEHRIYEHDPILDTSQWAPPPAHGPDPWAAMMDSSFDVPESLSPYSPPFNLAPALPHILPRPSSPSDASSGRLSPLSTFDSSASPSRRSSIDTPPKRCSHCAATTTPLWRRNPATHQPLCNACGLYLQQRSKMRPLALIQADQAEEEDDFSVAFAPDAPECSHCHTRKTSVWRRSKAGEKLCNACGVYLRLRGHDRPLALRRNKIKPRCKHAK
ncbi:hypothetical protein C8R44DRAFT_822965 [Mycena epipterygia]|nr:hypothetical protein C8R44DRAFT_822965 [Mycena epipterygia]